MKHAGRGEAIAAFCAAGRAAEQRAHTARYDLARGVRGAQRRLEGALLQCELARVGAVIAGDPDTFAGLRAPLEIALGELRATRAGDPDRAELERRVGTIRDQIAAFAGSGR